MHISVFFFRLDMQTLAYFLRIDYGDIVAIIFFAKIIFKRVFRKVIYCSENKIFSLDR